MNIARHGWSVKRNTPSRLVRAFLLASTLALTLGLVACGREEAAPTPQYTSQPPQADQKKHMLFSVHPLQNPQLLHEKFEPLMVYLSNHIPGVVFDLETSNDYADFERKLREGRADFALPNPYHAALSRDWGYHVVAKMGNDDLFRGVFIVRKDSPIKTVADVRGKVVAYPAPTALAAAMMPQLYLQKNGLDVLTEVKNQYVGTHNSSIMNAYLRQSDISATWPVAWSAFVKANPKEAADLRVIWQTPKLIQNAIVARKDVPVDIRDQVVSLLTTLQAEPAGQKILSDIDTVNFVPANDQDYEVVKQFLAEFNQRVKKQP